MLKQSHSLFVNMLHSVHRNGDHPFVGRHCSYFSFIIVFALCAAKLCNIHPPTPPAPPTYAALQVYSYLVALFPGPFFLYL